MRQRQGRRFRMVLIALVCAVLIGSGGALALGGVAAMLPRAPSTALAPALASPTSSSAVAPSVAPPAATQAPAASAAPAEPTALVAAPQPAPVANVPNVRVSAGNYTAHSEVSLAQNPRNSQQLVGASKMFTDNANYVFRVGTYRSSDGGATWTDNGQLAGLEEFALTSDPVVVFDTSGAVYVEVLAATRGRQQRSAIYLYKSTDGGATWAEPVLITNDQAGFNDKEWLAVDITGGVHNGTLYTTWVQITGETYRILLARSLDGGATWSEPRVLAADDRISRQGAVVSVGRDGAVYVLWSNLSNSYFESVVSLDGGVSFSAPRRGLAFTNVQPLNGNLRRSFVIPGFAADPGAAGTLHLIWDDGRLGNSDVLYSRSTDGGATWAPPVVVNGSMRGDQFQPWVAVGPDGAVVAQWFDRRDDPRNLLVHTYAARSTDGGRTWSELRVTDVASDPTVGLPLSGKAGFYGDYQALVVDAARTLLFWNETRDGSQEVYSAGVDAAAWGKPYAVPDAGPPRPNKRPTQEADE